MNATEVQPGGDEHARSACVDILIELVSLPVPDAFARLIELRAAYQKTRPG